MINAKTVKGVAQRWGMLVAIGLTTTVGCAPDSDNSDLEEQGAGATRESPADEHASAPGSGSQEKALKKDYCCVIKKGDRVKECIDYFDTKAFTGLWCRATLTDNVVRDGRCIDYQSCRGKGAEPWPANPN